MPLASTNLARLVTKEDLNKKADTSTLIAELALKANSSTLTAGLALKADSTDLASKADSTALDLKANAATVTQMNTTLGGKAPTANPTFSGLVTTSGSGLRIPGANQHGNLYVTSASGVSSLKMECGAAMLTAQHQNQFLRLRHNVASGCEVRIGMVNNDGSVSSGNDGNGRLLCGTITCSGQGTFEDLHANNLTYTLSVVTVAHFFGSDDRLKHNEVAIENGLEVVRQLKPEKYDKTREMMDADYNGPLTDSVVESGFIAQDVAQIPELTHLVHDGTPMALNYNGLHAYTVSAIQALDDLVQSQQARIAALEARFS